MDYETFGEHQWTEAGIFDFIENLAPYWTKQGGGFMTVSEVAEKIKPVDEIDVPYTTSWADSERDLSAWLGNSMQQEAQRHLYELEDSVLRTGDDSLIADWRRLQTSDHVYYMHQT
jgi:alpha-amylase